MPIVAMPDGTQVNFPDDMSSGQIKDLISQKFPDTSAPDFASRMSSDFAKRSQQLMNAKQGFESGQQGNTVTALDTLGAGGGLVGDLFGNLSTSTYRLLPQSVRDLIHGGLQSSLQGIGQGITAIAPDAGKGLQAIQGAIGQATQQYPTSSKIVGDIANIASAVPAIQGLGMMSNIAGSALEGTGKKLADIASKKLDSFYADAVIPKQTAKEIKSGLRDTVEQGINRNQVVQPNQSDLEVIDTLKNVPGFSPNKSLLGNANIVRKELKNETTALEGKLNASGISVPVQDFQAPFDAFRDKVDNLQGITEDTRKLLHKPIDVMEEITNRKNGQISLSDILKARRNLDTELSIASGEKLTPAIQKVYYQGVKDLRDYTNQYIDSKVPGTLDSLQKQSALIRADKQMSTKLPSAPKSRGEAIGRAISDVIPGKTPLGKALVVGVPGAASIATGAAPFLAAGAGIGGLAKILTSRPVLGTAGKILMNAGELLK